MIKAMCRHRISISNSSKVFLILVIACLCTGCSLRSPMKAYAGQWVLRSKITDDVAVKDNILMVVKLEQHHHQLRGTITQPSFFREMHDGTFQTVKMPTIVKDVVGLQWKYPQATLVVRSGEDRTHYPVMLAGPDHLILDLFDGHVPPLWFERVSADASEVVAKDWPSDASKQPQ